MARYFSGLLYKVDYLDSLEPGTTSPGDQTQDKVSTGLAKKLVQMDDSVALPTAFTDDIPRFLRGYTKQASKVLQKLVGDPVVLSSDFSFSLLTTKQSTLTLLQQQARGVEAEVRGAEAAVVARHLAQGQTGGRPWNVLVSWPHDTEGTAAPKCSDSPDTIPTHLGVHKGMLTWLNDLEAILNREQNHIKEWPANLGDTGFSMLQHTRQWRYTIELPSPSWISATW